MPNDHENWFPWLTKAEFSPDRKHRYTLERRWSPGPGRTVAFIGLNPSTADENQDDPTVRRCIRYAKKWGYSGMVMLNIFSLRSTDPRGLYDSPEPNGPDNDYHINHTVFRDDVELVVACWGNHGAYRDRGMLVKWFIERAGHKLHRLGPLTKLGHPRHPLYLKGDLKPELL